MKIYYDIDDLPLKLFAKISKTGDIKLIVYEGTATTEELIEAWDKINRQFFDLMGIKDNQQHIINAKIAYLKHITNYYIKGDRMSKTKANLEAQKLEMFEKLDGGGTVDFMKMVVSISKALEMRLDYNSLTTSEFFHYMNLAEDMSKAMAKAYKK